MGAPDYYKSILLYGLYNGAPVPMMVDEQGRFVFVVEAISPWSRSGTVILVDDFTQGLTKVAAEYSGTGGSIALDYTYSLEGGIACKLVGGKNFLRYAEVGYYIHPSSFTKLGAEWQYQFWGWYDTFDVIARIWTGTRRLDAHIRHNYEEQAWQVYDYASAAWVSFLTGVTYEGLDADFYRFKLVLDIENECYHSFRYSASLVDLTAYTLDGVDNADVPREYIEFRQVSREDCNDWGRLDIVILTQDES